MILCGCNQTFYIMKYSVCGTLREILSCHSVFRVTGNQLYESYVSFWTIQSLQKKKNSLNTWTPAIRLKWMTIHWTDDLTNAKIAQLTVAMVKINNNILVAFIQAKKKNKSVFKTDKRNEKQKKKLFTLKIRCYVQKWKKHTFHWINSNSSCIDFCLCKVDLQVL